MTCGVLDMLMDAEKMLNQYWIQSIRRLLNSVNIQQIKNKKQLIFYLDIRKQNEQKTGV